MNDEGDVDGAAAGGAAAGIPRVPGLVMLRRLGRGGHGEVWLAAELASGERVAVKVRGGSTGRHAPDGDPDHGPGGDPGDGPDGDTKARQAREIAVLKRIDHPHVVRLRRVVDLPDGGRALVMDLASGGSLAALVAIRGSLDPPEACTVVVPLARTLADLHGRGLIHGDLTPANVLFTADGRPMIADLGCAAVLGERSGQLWGSDGYVDPARAAGAAGTADPAADVYALGALLRFALTGDPAEEADERVGGDDPRSGALLALADLCTAPDPRRRPSPQDVARTALAATPAAPVRLLPTEPVPVAAPPSAAKPPSAVKGQSAADRGWTRPPLGTDRHVEPHVDPQVDPHSALTSATGLPLTSTDLGLDPARGRQAPDARRTPTTGSGPAAVTRRRTRPPVTEPGPSDSRRARRDAGGRRSGSARAGRGVFAGPEAGSSWRGLGLTAAVILVVTGGAWLLLGSLRPGPAEATDASRATPALTVRAPVAAGGVQGPGPGRSQLAVPTLPTTRPTTRPTAAVQPTTEGPQAAPAEVVEPLEDAVSRLARARAEAFRTVTVSALAPVDEPGSAAFAADAALIGRLKAQGLRLEGLTFAVAGVRGLSRQGPAVTVAAVVTTSGHRQVVVSDGSLHASVPESAPREVLLTLVPAPDRRTWLIRDSGAAQGRTPRPTTP